MFDVETLGVSSNSVILSMACIYFNPEEKPSYQNLIDSAFFVKFCAKDQITNYNRTVSNSTLRWWNTQPLENKMQSFIPTDHDSTAVDGLNQFREWVIQYTDYKNSTVWARGNLDQIILHSLENDVGQETLLPFWSWRDVRTAVDILSGSNNGYCPVNYPGFDLKDVVKHNPIHDCAYDAMMLMYGSTS